MVKKCLLSALVLVMLGLQVVMGQRVVVIGLDGLSVEGYEQANIPHLQQLMSEGVLSLTTRSVMPSVTLPNWTSHLTGSGPEQHGVVNNQWTLAQHELPPTEADGDGYFPSIFKAVKDQIPGVKTAYYYNWVNLIHPINQTYLDEVSYLEDDRYIENYDKAIRFLEENTDSPTLIFLYSVHTDHAGHGFEWISSEYITSLEEADQAIGDLLGQLKGKDLYEDTHFFLITDHGGIGKSHGGVTEQEMLVPWGGDRYGHRVADHIQNATIRAWLEGLTVFRCVGLFRS